MCFKDYADPLMTKSIDQRNKINGYIYELDRTNFQYLQLQNSHQELLAKYQALLTSRDHLNSENQSLKCEHNQIIASEQRLSEDFRELTLKYQALLSSSDQVNEQNKELVASNQRLVSENREIEFLKNQINSLNSVNSQLVHINAQLINNESNLKEQHNKEIQKIKSHYANLIEERYGEFLDYLDDKGIDY